MLIHFAYTENHANARDLKAALADKKHPMVLFELEASVLDATKFSGPSFKTNLLDNSTWQTWARKRRVQQITTKPNLLLSGMKMEFGIDKGKFLTYRDLLVRWYWARGAWINTGTYDLSSFDNNVKNLVQVVRESDEISFQMLNGIRWAISAQLTIGTGASE